MASDQDPIYVLGAGPAGLAAAYQLTKSDRRVVVVERDERVGGLAKSFTYQGFILDQGPHRFSAKAPPVLKMWDEVLGDQQVVVKRLTRICYRGKFFPYPLALMETLRALGPVEALQILASYGEARLHRQPNPANYAEWLTDRFGKRLFEIFFEGYTEKLWGIPCTEISAEWAAQRIKGVSLVSAVKTALLGSDGTVKSMIDEFQYPKLGSGQLYDRIAEFITGKGQSLAMQTETVSIQHEKNRVTSVKLRDVKTKEERSVPVGAAISSIPITHLLTQLDPPPPPAVLDAAKSLRFRNTILVYVFAEGANLFPDNWLYINDERVQLGRVTNFANWSSSMLPNRTQTPLCCEYWSFFEEKLWSATDAELLELAKKDLRTVGLLKGERVTDGLVLRLPRVYPLYSGNYKQALATIQAYLAPFENLQLIGRYGTFKYNNQDHSLLMGIMAAENILGASKQDLWAVNSDSEYLEETKVRPS